jgi:hypothetical protein
MRASLCGDSPAIASAHLPRGDTLHSVAVDRDLVVAFAELIVNRRPEGSP